jgi:hypothetical protein
VVKTYALIIQQKTVKSSKILRFVFIAKMAVVSTGQPKWQGYRLPLFLLSLKISANPKISSNRNTIAIAESPNFQE